MIKIYGSSDDLVEIEGSTHEDEINAEWVELIIGNREADAGVDAHGLRVVMRYAPSNVDAAVWVAQVGPVDEDAACPWPVVVKVEGYTAVVEIDCPADTPIAVKTPE